MLSTVNGKNGDVLYSRHGAPPFNMIPPSPSSVNAALNLEQRSVSVTWSYEDKKCRAGGADAVEVRAVMRVAHAKPDPTAGSRGEPMYNQAPFAQIAMEDVDVSAGSCVLTLPSDDLLLEAANSTLKPEEVGAGKDLPMYVCRRTDGATELQIQVAVKGIAKDTALAWDETSSDAIPYVTSAAA